MSTAPNATNDNRHPDATERMLTFAEGVKDAGAVKMERRLRAEVQASVDYLLSLYQKLQQDKENGRIETWAYDGMDRETARALFSLDLDEMVNQRFGVTEKDKGDNSYELQQAQNLSDLEKGTLDLSDLDKVFSAAQQLINARRLDDAKTLLSSVTVAEAINKRDPLAKHRALSIANLRARLGQLDKAKDIANSYATPLSFDTQTALYYATKGFVSEALKYAGTNAQLRIGVAEELHYAGEKDSAYCILTSVWQDVKETKQRYFHLSYAIEIFGKLGYVDEPLSVVSSNRLNNPKMVV